MKKFLITKASGETVPFSTRKLRKSLRRGGAGGEEINYILAELERNAYPGITTEEIYQRAFELLKEANTHWAGRYKLKRAIQELGPSGFPFERFISELLRAQGYDTQTGVLVEGLCVSHEVDVVAQNGSGKILAECKFHSLPGNQSDVKIPLYIKSRFDDISQKLETNGEDPGFRRWVVTNTRFTGDAIRYGVCAGLNLVSWDFPEKGSLRYMIDKNKLYPITCLTTLSSREKAFFLSKNVVLASDLPRREDLIRKADISKERFAEIVSECGKLCK